MRKLLASAVGLILLAGVAYLIFQLLDWNKFAKEEIQQFYSLRSTTAAINAASASGMRHRFYQRVKLAKSVCEIFRYVP